MIEELMNAFEEYIDAKKQHDDAKKTCEYDWGYFGYDFIENKKEKANVVGELLNNLIDQRVEKK